MKIDAVDELIARSNPHPVLQKFHRYHREHPEILAFLVEEIQLRLKSGFTAFSFHSLCEYCRWKLQSERGPSDTFFLNDRDVPMYARVITILWPEFNGLAEFRKSRADEILGLRPEVVEQRAGVAYARRLVWEDGTPLDRGWRPTLPRLVEPSIRRKQDIHARAS